MLQLSAGSLEPDERFPSGEWSGYFLQPATGEQQHWMSFQLEFREGILRGEGTDFVGPFSLLGRYETESGKCYWTKQYINRHAVLYHGFNLPHGIVGEWTIVDCRSGQFHIWPKGLGNLEEHYLRQAATLRPAW